MAKQLLAALGLVFACAMSASAADLCNCCGEAVAGPCASACQTVETTAGQCIPIVDFDGKAEIGPGKNALYEFSLRNLRVSKTDDHSLERFRRLLERLRRAAEADRKLGLRDRRRGKIDDAGAAALAARYDGAIVNYYLGAQAYRLAKHN